MVAWRPDPSGSFLTCSRNVATGLACFGTRTGTTGRRNKTISSLQQPQRRQQPKYVSNRLLPYLVQNMTRTRSYYVSRQCASSLSGMTRALFAPASVGRSRVLHGLSVELLLPSQVHARVRLIEMPSSSNLHNRLASSSNSRSTLKVQLWLPNHRARPRCRRTDRPERHRRRTNHTAAEPRGRDRRHFPGTRLITTTDD